MKNTFPKKQTRAEDAYVRDMARTSALKKVDRGLAHLVPAEELPEPLKRFAARSALRCISACPPRCVAVFSP